MKITAVKTFPLRYKLSRRLCSRTRLFRQSQQPHLGQAGNRRRNSVDGARPGSSRRLRLDRGMVRAASDWSRSAGPSVAMAPALGAQFRKRDDIGRGGYRSGRPARKSPGPSPSQNSMEAGYAIAAIYASDPWLPRRRGRQAAISAPGRGVRGQGLSGDQAENRRPDHQGRPGCGRRGPQSRRTGT